MTIISTKYNPNFEHKQKLTDFTNKAEIRKINMPSDLVTSVNVLVILFE